MEAPVLVTAAAILIAAIVLAFAVVPRRLISRAQDRRAEERTRREPDVRLLTRAELVGGRWRRAPGLLALGNDAISFEGLFDESWVLATSRIGKIATGRKMTSGRLLFRQEVLRITSNDGTETEFVLTPAAAGAWRSHLGLWAMAERVRDAGRAEQVVPGRDRA